MANNGNRGKFSDRLKRILFFKRKKINNDCDNVKIEDSNKIYLNFVKVVSAIPGVVYGAVSNNNDIKNGHEITNNEKMVQESEQIDESLIQKDIKTRQNKRELISKINVNSIRNSQNVVPAEKVSNHTGDCTDEYLKLKALEKSIINLIKKDLIRTVNEMEILQSELYILSEVNGDDIVLSKCQEELNRVKDMLCKIDKLKEQYDFLKDNYDFEYLLELENNDLVDKIIELRNTFDNHELRIVSEDYKLLDVYKYLYLKIDDLQEKTALFALKKDDELAKLRERDIDFEKLKQEVYNVDVVNKNYCTFVSSQNEILQRIDSDVSKINSYDVSNYYLKGFNDLFRNSFKYFGLLMVSPLKGIIPSIATETLITGNLIRNLYKNLSWEQEKHIIYEAIDYSNMIGGAINDLEGTSRMVDATLDDIIHLKMEYNEKFKKYHGDFLEYREIMQKISNMENKIIGNKIKIEMLRKKALEQKKINDTKLVKIKELNRGDNQ